MPVPGFAYAEPEGNNDLSIPVGRHGKPTPSVRSAAGRRHWIGMSGLGYRRWLGLGAVIAGGPLLIGIFMAVFSARPRSLTQSDQKAIDRATHDNWGEEQVH
jgi:hypothetical protein